MRAIRLVIVLAWAGLCLAASLQQLNVKFKVPGYFVALPNIRAKPIDVLPATEKITLKAFPDRAVAFGKYEGFAVVLANATRKKLIFESQDSRINIVREALDADGRWKPIEYLPNGFCGNSYYAVFLPARRSWTFRAPHYNGPFKTRMRFVLEQQDLKLVSNEFAGSINREQFTVVRKPEPWDIMDPYSD